MCPGGTKRVEAGVQGAVDKAAPPRGTRRLKLGLDKGKEQLGRGTQKLKLGGPDRGSGTQRLKLGRGGGGGGTQKIGSATQIFSRPGRKDPNTVRSLESSSFHLNLSMSTQQQLSSHTDSH